MRKDYGTRKKMMGGGMTKKRTMMKNGGLKMVSKNGKKLSNPSYRKYYGSLLKGLK